MRAESSLLELCRAQLDIVYQKRTIVIVVFYLLHVQTACSPADYADHAERMQQAASYRRERQVGMVKAVLLFGVCLRKSARSA